MREVTFYFNVADLLGHACNLIRSAQRRGRAIVVLAEKGLLEQVSGSLWGKSPESFVPHGLDGDTTPTVRYSQVLLTSRLDSEVNLEIAPDVLLNLLPGVPMGCERFATVLEVVAQGDLPRESGRQRWKAYSNEGWRIKKSDVADQKAPI